METKKEEINIPDYLKLLLDQLDEAPAAIALDQIQGAIGRNHASQAAESERLLKKYGSEHPRVKTAQARVAFNGFFGKSVDQGISRAKVETVAKIPDVWQVHGRVFDAELNPQKDITVFLASDTKGANWVRSLGHACTDARGYWSISVNREVLYKLSQTLLYLAASNARKKLVYRSEEELKPELNERIYREIVLSEGKICVEPPDETSFEKENVQVGKPTETPVKKGKAQGRKS